MQIKDLTPLNEVVEVSKILGSGWAYTDVETDAGSGYSAADSTAIAYGDAGNTHTRTYTRASRHSAYSNAQAIAQSVDNGDFSFSVSTGGSSYFKSGSQTSRTSFEVNAGY
ncbi:MAG: hypothetical protein AAFV72_06020 [Cyanobacteria bacterium J06635_1]